VEGSDPLFILPGEWFPVTIIAFRAGTKDRVWVKVIDEPAGLRRVRIPKLPILYGPVRLEVHYGDGHIGYIGPAAEDE
jgi:hypothetical protein